MGHGKVMGKVREGGEMEKLCSGKSMQPLKSCQTTCMYTCLSPVHPAACLKHMSMWFHTWYSKRILKLCILFRERGREREGRAPAVSRKAWHVGRREREGLEAN